jgi:hypothetical protein
MNKFMYTFTGFDVSIVLSRNPYGSHSAVYERDDQLDPANWTNIYGDVQVAREIRKDLEWAIAQAEPELIRVISEALATVMQRIEPTEYGSSLTFTKSELDRLSIGKRCRAHQYKTGSVELTGMPRPRGRRGARRVVVAA